MIGCLRTRVHKQPIIVLYFEPESKPIGGLNAFYLNLALDSAVVEVQEMFSSHGGHLTNAMYHHGETV